MLITDTLFKQTTPSFLILCRLMRMAHVAALLGIAVALPGQMDLIVDTDTAWPEGEYLYNSVQVTNDATLTIAGGSSVTITGALVIDGGCAILTTCKNVDGLVDGTWQGEGVEIEAGMLTIGTGAVLSADLMGYQLAGLNASGTGPGAGISGGGYGSGGGSHGGHAGNGDNARAGAPYGDPFAPLTPGSSGGAGDQGTAEAHGGGAIKLKVGGTLQLDGTISANGGDATGDTGGGAGGSIWIEVETLGGSGMIEAHGGVAEWGAGGGSGGRVAVYFETLDAFDMLAQTDIYGGVATYQSGGDGTAVFIDKNPANTDLYIAHRLDVDEDSSLTFHRIELLGNSILELGGGSHLVAQDELVLGDAAVLFCIGKNRTTRVDGTWQGEGVTIEASTISIAASARIDADLQGYRLNAPFVDGSGPGGGTNGNWFGSGGGGYGGRGGDGDNGAGGFPYGSALEPVDLGSAGGASDNGTFDAHGGGAIRLIVADRLQLDGLISANGGTGTIDTGGGSGGSIWVTTSILAGSGMISARGGSADSGSGGGSGGRIAVYYANVEDFDFDLQSDIAGGSAVHQSGEDGTGVFIDTSTSGYTVSIPQRFWTDEDSMLAWGEVRLLQGAWLELGGGSTLSIERNLDLGENAVVICRGKNRTTLVEEAWQGEGVTIEANDVTVSDTAWINADLEGYALNAMFVDGSGPGGGQNGNWYGSGGGAHGGRGGSGDKGAGGLPYGSALEPVDLGSAGGSSDDGTFDAHGGGAIRLIVADRLQLDGLISANGGSGTGDTGGGAGGSIWLTASIIGGSGSLSVRGGAAEWSSGGGSGGRLAVYYREIDGFDIASQSDVSGGTATYQDGEDGTGIFLDEDLANYAAFIPQNYWLGKDEEAQFGSLDIYDTAILRMDGGSLLTVDGLLAVRQNSTIYCETKNRTAMIDGAWMGEGIQIRAGQLEVESGSAINGDARGYQCPAMFVDGAGPGGGINGNWYGSGGGGHGGPGGDGDGGRGGGVYGSEILPTTPGSAGGTSDQGQLTGHGGGSVRIDVSGALCLDGQLSANGGPGTQDGGGGAGGSILISSRSLYGGGVIESTGGSAEWGSGGGGGGRIAIYTPDISFDMARISASGGFGGYSHGGNGIIRLFEGPYLHWIQPEQYFVHGQSILEWEALGVGYQTTGRLSVPGAQPEQVVGTTLPVEGTTTWDTTILPDGVHELRFVFRDSSQLVTGDFATLMTVINSVEWRAGTLLENELWNAANVYIVERDLIIPSGIVLTIEPTTVVKFLRGVRVIIEDGGQLLAPGSVGAPVVFTSIYDDSAAGDTNLDGTQSVPHPGDWGGIDMTPDGYLDDTGEFDIRYAIQRHQGIIALDEIWDARMLHLITGHVVIPNQTNVTIQPGAIVKFNPWLGIEAQSGGSLIALGNSAQPIFFTSVRDDSIGGDTNADKSRSKPAAGDWRWLHANGGSIQLEHATVRYAAGTASGQWEETGAIRTSGNADVAMRRCRVEESLFNGMLQLGGMALIENCVYTDADRGIQTSAGQIDLVHSIVDACSTGVFLHGGSMQMVNSMVTNCSSAAISICCGSSPPDMHYSNVWGEEGTLFAGFSDPTGTNGNVSVDPRFRDTSLGDYHVAYMSPMIDAGDGSRTTPGDFVGAARYDDPRTPNTGIETDDGAFPDIGIFEFVESAPSPIDLVVDSVSAPALPMAGERVIVNWTETNVGSAIANGPWRNRIALVPSGDTVGPALIAGEVLVNPGFPLGPGESVAQSASVRVPGGVEGEYKWMVRTNARSDVFEGINLHNNETLSDAVAALTVPELLLDGPSITHSFALEPQDYWYRVAVPLDSPVRIHFQQDELGGESELYISRDVFPSLFEHDARGTVVDAFASEAFLPAVPQPSDVYILLHRRTTGGIMPKFSVKAVTPPQGIASVQPDTVGNMGVVQLAITGFGFDGSEQVMLTGPARAGYSPISMRLVDGSHLTADFDLRNATPGDYALEINNDQFSDSLDHAVRIAAGLGGNIWVSIEGRSQVRVGRWAEYTIRYGNNGVTNAYGTTIGITGITRDVEVELSSGFAPYTYPDPLEQVDPAVYTVDEIKLLPTIRVGLLAPGQTGAATIRLRGTREEEITVGTMLMGPMSWFPGIENGLSGRSESGSSRDWFCTFPPEDVKALREANDVAWDIYYKNNFLLRFWNDACVGAAQSLVDGLADRGNRPGNLLNGWRFQRITKNGYGLGHTTVLMISPSGNAYIVDNYVQPTILPLQPSGDNQWIIDEECRRVILDNLNSFLWLEALVMGTDPNNTVAWKPLNNESPVVCRPPNKGPSKTFIEFLASLDPNEKTHTPGTGTDGYVSETEPIVYTVHFENLETASIPAQRVIIEDMLPAGIDPATLEWVEIGFNTVRIPVSPGIQQFTMETSVPTDPNPVLVFADVETSTGLVLVTMESRSPDNGELPEDPFAGFLPPNDASGHGAGYIRFSARPRTGLADGTVLTNTARIFFDENAPIDTNFVTNTLDTNPPDAVVNPLPASIAGYEADVSWVGTDGDGSGVAYFDVYLSVDGSDWIPWLLQTDLSNATFRGMPGSVYAFAARAVDKVGLQEEAPILAETSTMFTAPRIHAPAGVIDFGVALVGTGTQIVRTVSIANIGDQPLQVDSFGIAGANADDFAVIGSPGLPRTIPPQGQITLEMQFTPSAHGLSEGILRIQSNDPVQTPFDVPLYGAGIVYTGWMME